MGERQVRWYGEAGGKSGSGDPLLRRQSFWQHNQVAGQGPGRGGRGEGKVRNCGFCDFSRCLNAGFSTSFASAGHLQLQLQLNVSDLHVITLFPTLAP